MTASTAAVEYIARGFLPIPIPYREKAPILDKWQALRLKAEHVPRHFNGATQNIGLLLGDDYGTADVDLDSPEAIAAAGELLPETGMIFGRESKPRSHFFYRCDPPTRSKRFLDPIDKSCLVEFRCRKSDGTAGLQTVVPPSVHPSGEVVRFEPDGDGHPANVESDILLRAVSDLAAVSLLGRHWPAKGSRNAAFLALSGVLVRAGWELDHAERLHGALYRILWGAGANLEAAKAEVEATYEKHAGGFQTTGKHSLYDLMDRRVVRTALSWLGISTAPPPRDEDAPPEKRDKPTAQRIVRSKSIDIEALMEDDTISAPELAIEGFLPRVGLVLFGGRPKEGKSWFACQTALSFATGEPLGGWLRVLHPGRVHLWALEDQFALTKDKIGKLLGGKRPDTLRDIRVFAELAQPVLRGGDAIIRAALDEHPVELVIFDSLFKLAGHDKPGQDISQRDYDIIDKLRKIALDYKCVVVVVMHTRKGSRGGNPIENLMNTSGTTAAADAACELSRTGYNGKLTVTGRMVPLRDYELMWHAGEQWGWTIESEGEEAAIGETSREVVAYLEAQGAASPASIASALHKSFGSVWMTLKRLQERGAVVRGSDKKWQIRL